MELHTPAEVLRCGDDGFDEEEASQLLERHANATTRLSVANHRLDMRACMSVLGVLNKMDRLTYLSLTDQHLTSECIAIIGDALRATPLAAPLPVTTLALESCGISDEDGAILLRKLRDNPYIEQLFLSGNELALESCKALAECMAMQASNVFTVVQLGYNAVTPACVELLQESVSRHRRLQSLSLHGNLQLSDSGCAILCDSLRTDTLQMLNLAGTNLRGVELSHLCRLIQESVVLAELILAQNYLSDEAIPPLSTALEESASLRTLDLSYNCFGKGESFALGECLARNKTIVQLNLAGNLLSTRTVEAIAAGLEHNHSLVALDFSRCCLNDDDLRILVAGILKNNTLVELQCDGNNWCADGSDRIVAALASETRHMKSSLEMLFAMVDWNKTRAREMHADQLAAGLATNVPPPPSRSPSPGQSPAVTQSTRKNVGSKAKPGMRRMSFVESIKRQVQSTQADAAS